MLITRLSALHDITSMTVLCSDKTGTLTRNEATVNALWPAPGFSENDLLRAAALAPDKTRWTARLSRPPPPDHGWHDGEIERTDFKPFRPGHEAGEKAMYREKRSRRYVKGQFHRRRETGWHGGFPLATAGRSAARGIRRGGR